MNTFEDLIFKPYNKSHKLKQAKIKFSNDYGVSVLFGDLFYSNGKNTYEIAIFYKDSFIYADSGNNVCNVLYGSYVLGFLTKEEVSLKIKEIQELI